MFLNILTIVGLALSSQGNPINNKNDFRSTAVFENPLNGYAAESGYTADYETSYSDEVHADNGDLYHYEFGYSFGFGSLALGYADLVGFALGILLAVALVARRLETGTWPAPRYVRLLVIPVALVATGFGVALLLEGLPVLESLLGFAGPSWGRGLALAAGIGYDAVIIGAELMLPRTRAVVRG